MTSIILRKDFQRIRTRVRNRVRRGRICAELEEARRIERVVDALDGKIDFYNGNESESEIAEILQAILAEWRELTEDEIVWRFRQVVVAGALRIMVEKREVETSCDSYGRMMYRMKELGTYK